MRRAFAIPVLAAICYSLLAPFLFAETQANLPACCRRFGRHHCAMSMDAPPGTPSLAERCPMFPVPMLAPPSGAAASPEDSSDLSVAFVTLPAIQRAAESQARISFSRSRQKRGPPASLFD